MPLLGLATSTYCTRFSMCTFCLFAEDLIEDSKILGDAKSNGGRTFRASGPPLSLTAVECDLNKNETWLCEAIEVICYGSQLLPIPLWLLWGYSHAWIYFFGSVLPFLVFLDFSTYFLNIFLSFHGPLFSFSTCILWTNLHTLTDSQGLLLICWWVKVGNVFLNIKHNSY